MLPLLTVPASLAGLLQVFRPCFTRASFSLFTVLVVGLVRQTGRRTVCGMLLGSALAGGIGHGRAHRFFSTARWSADEVGLVLARLVVERILPAGAPVEVAVDDTVFARRGRKIHGGLWAHDGSVPGTHKLRWGHRWVLAGLVVRLPMLSRPVCLPVLARLWAGRDTASPVRLAADLVGLVAAWFPDRLIHVVADAAYHGPALKDLPTRVSWTTRVPANAVFHGLTPPRTGRPGRPRVRGARYGTATDLAATLTWRRHTISRYGRTVVVAAAEITCLWYGAFAARTGRLILVRDITSGKPHDLALFTTDLTSDAAVVVTRYAGRWSIETAIATAKGPAGVGQARNRTPQAVHRTIPFGLIVMSVVTVWYALHGHHTHDVTSRRQRTPWYTSKTEPSFEDMIIKLRRTLIAAGITPRRPGQPTPEEFTSVLLAWEAAAA